MTLNDNEPWFAAVDVCRAIGLAIDPNTDKVVFSPKRFPTLRPDEVGKQRMYVNLRDGRRQTRMIYALSESGLYKLVMRSYKPAARQFQDWVTREVLPAIRKDGAYIKDEEKVRTGEMSEDAPPMRTTLKSPEKSERVSWRWLA